MSIRGCVYERRALLPCMVSSAFRWRGSKGAARLEKPWEKTLVYPLRRFGEHTPSHAITLVVLLLLLGGGRVVKYRGPTGRRGRLPARVLDPEGNAVLHTPARLYEVRSHLRSPASKFVHAYEVTGNTTSAPTKSPRQQQALRPRRARARSY